MRVSTAPSGYSYSQEAVIHNQEAVTPVPSNDHKNVDHKTSIAFQSHIEKSQTLAEEIQKSWQTVPSLMCLKEQTQEAFSQIIAHEIQKLSESGQPYSQIHYDKKTIHQLNREVFVKSPFTFYISIKPEKDKAVVSINDEKKVSKIGRGSRKNVYSGIKIHIPLNKKQEGKPIEIAGSAISHPVDGEPFDYDLAEILKVHRTVYDAMEKAGFPGSLTKPPKIREHIQKSTSKKKQDLTQSLYLSDMQKLILDRFYLKENGKRIFLSIHKRLDLIVEFFDSISAIHDLGWVHRDVKPGNILITREKDSLHSLVHDFDLTCRGPVSRDPNHHYFFWDHLGKWLVSVSSDLVGCMLTAIEILYNSVDYEDSLHQNYSKGVDHAFDVTMIKKIKCFIKKHDLPCLSDRTPEKAIEHLDSLSKSKEDPFKLQYKIRMLKIEAELCLKVMKLFCGYFEKESSWKNEMITSAVSYYIELGKDVKKDLDLQNKELFLAGVHYDFKEKMIEDLAYTLSKLGYSPEICRNLGLDAIIQKISMYHSQENTSYTDPILLSDKVKFTYLLNQIKNLETFLTIPPEQIYDYENSEIFFLLNSRNPEDRAKGRQLEYERFGKVSDLSTQIRQFATEFKEDSAKIEKEFEGKVPVKVLSE